MSYLIKTFKKFKYVEVGSGETLILLHGLFGALSNFTQLINHFEKKYRVVFPILPLFDLDMMNTSVSGLQKYIHEFIETMEYDSIHLIGNSLGGHVALLHALKEKKSPIKTLTLTGSSGLFENGMGDTYPKRRDYEYIKTKAALTFYDPSIADKELVDEVFQVVNNRIKALKVVAFAKSAIRNNLQKDLHLIKYPTLLIWGKNDIVTPPFVAEDFHKLIPNSKLCFIDKCGHAPMMEVPKEFNRLLDNFLNQHVHHQQNLTTTEETIL